MNEEEEGNSSCLTFKKCRLYIKVHLRLNGETSWSTLCCFGSTMDPRCSLLGCCCSRSSPHRSSHQIRANDLIWQESSQSHRPCRDWNNSWKTADSAATPQKYAAASDASAKNLSGHQITSLVWEVMHTRPFETFWFSSFYRNDRPSFSA